MNEPILGFSCPFWGIRGPYDDEAPQVPGLSPKLSPQLTDEEAEAAESKWTLGIQTGSHKFQNILLPPCVALPTLLGL